MCANIWYSIAWNNVRSTHIQNLEIWFSNWNSESALVESSLKSQHDEGEFDHLVAYSLACTFENAVVSARKYESICFRSLDEVIKVGDLVCLDEGKGMLMEGFEVCSSGRAWWARSCQAGAARQKLLDSRSGSWADLARVEQRSAPHNTCFCFMSDSLWAFVGLS